MAKDEPQWQEAGLANKDIWDRKAPIEGELLRAKENTGPNESMLYEIKTKDGIVSVWGSTVLDTKLEGVPVGCEVRIEPQGLTKSPKTGREYLDFKVFFKDTPFKEVTEGGEDITGLEMPPDFLQD